METYNFSAGPAMLPPEVIAQIREDLPEWKNVHASVMEISHRSAAFSALLEEAKADIAELLQLPNNYKVLFMHGGAAGQFAAAPMNLLRGKTQADYVNTGHWSQRAMEEAGIYCKVNEVASAVASKPYQIPEQSTWQLNPDAAYLHYTSNATIYGVQFKSVPNVDVPLVADMSSDVFSRPIDVSKFALIYASAQKNLGAAGVTLVIVREDLIDQPWDKTPSILRYDLQAEKNSLYNTPCSFSIYVVSLVLKWIKQQGGLAAIAKANQAKAKKLYAAIDGIDLYENNVHPSCRSEMNVNFFLPSEELTQKFLQESSAAGLLSLKGYRTMGGVRASIYNAMPSSGVDALVEFMRDFAGRIG